MGMTHFSLMKGVEMADQVGKVVAVCPVCNSKIRNEKTIATQYVVMESPDKTSASFHKICCTECGVEFFPKEVLAFMKKRMEEPKIIIPGGGLS